MVSTPDPNDFGRLSVVERLDLIGRIWDSIDPVHDPIPLTDAQRDELERRADDDDTNPDDVVPWEDVLADALKRCGR